MVTPSESKEVDEIIRAAKDLALRYRNLTGRPLGITGEVAECEAIRLLGLELAPVRQSGYDAVRKNGNLSEKLQIKGRCVLKSTSSGERIGKIDLTKEWDAVLLILLNPELEPVEIYEAWRPEITEALTKPGSKSRNERGTLSIGKFRSIGKQIWSRSS